MFKISAPIVGGYFRPPAKQLLANLPAQAPLLLRLDPTNEYDEKAVQVWVRPESIPASVHGELELALEGTGWDLTQVMTSGVIQLGFVADSDGKALAKAGGGPGNREIGAALAACGQFDLEGFAAAALVFGPDGQARVEIDLVADTKPEGEP